MSAHSEQGKRDVGALPAKADIEALIRADHSDPFSVLGAHSDGGTGSYIRAYLPTALSVQVLAKDGGHPLTTLDQGDVPGLFTGHIEQSQPYLLRVQWAGGVQVSEDPYSYGNLLGDMDIYLFAEGKHRNLGSVFGAQFIEIDGVQGTRFAVWAPNAKRVSVVGDFNVWDGRRHPMRQRFPSGVWELFIPALQPGEPYKYEILGQHGILPLKADPIALCTELLPSTASRVAKPMQFAWDDDAWLDARADRHAIGAPQSIYELH
ncbi:MAG: 1,4-alpha-glucan branching enzyme, partial [Proteobacteria bacterium]